MSRFTSGFDINPDIRYNLTNAAQVQPDLFIGGNAIAGFDVTAAPPELGFWGVTFHDKQINATTLESGNATTWVLNRVVSPFVPGEQRFVSLGAGLLMNEAMGMKQEEIDGWKALSNRISPVINVAHLDQILKFDDQNFDAEEATSEWMKNETNATLRNLVQQHTGRDIEAIMSTARNAQHFHFLQMRELTHAQAMQNIGKWEEEAGFTTKWSSRIASFTGNYLLTDPSFAPSLFIGPGTLNLASKAPSVGLGILKAGRSVKAAGQSFILYAPSAAPRATAPAIFGKAAIGAKALLEAPAAAHAAFSSAIGHRAAVAVELGVYGGAWDAAIQQQRLAESEILFDDPDHQQHWSWAELGLSVALGGTLGFALAGRGTTRLAEARRGAVEAAGGNPSSPLSISFDNMVAQGLMDGAAIRGQRAAGHLLGDDFDTVAMYFDDTLLSEVGLHRFQVADALEELVFASGENQLPVAAVHRYMSDMFAEARKVKGRRAEIASDYAGSQLEEMAFAAALGRAARELPTATNSAVLERAVKHMPAELKAVEARMKSRSVTPAKGEELKYWKMEAKAMQESARRRSLSEADIDYMATISAKLESLGERNPFEGFAQSRSQRYLDGSIYAPFRPTANASELTKTTQKVMKERRLIAELEGARTLGDNVGNDLTNARKRLARAQQKLAALSAAESDRIVTEAGAKVREVAERYITNPPKTKAAKFRALDELAAAIDFNQNALMEDGTMLGRLITGWGLNSLRRLAQQGTGMDQTVRATLGVLREIAHEFDNSKLRVGSIDPSTDKVFRSMEDIRRDMQVRSSEMVDAYRELHNAGKFGSSVRFKKYKQARADFDKAVIKHITKTVTSDDPDVVAMAKLWQKNSDEIGSAAKQAGIFGPLDNFFPRRWHVGKIIQEPQRFITALARHFQSGWEESKIVHMDTLVSMGKLRREVDDQGRIFWADADGNEFAEGIKRTELTEKFGVTDEDYLKAMTTVNPETGLTPMTEAATRSRNNLTGDDSFETLSNGKQRRKQHGAPRSEKTRELEESVWQNADLEDFLDWRFLHGADQYLSSTGFRVMNNIRHQQRWGIPGLTMQDTIDWLDQRVVNVLGAKGEPEERRLWNDGIKTLREKLHFAEGRLPTIRDQTNGFGEWLGEVGTSLAGALYGSGIGQAILTTEVSQAIVSRVYGPTDIVRRVGDIFKVAVTNRKEMREQIQAMGLTVRQFRQHTLSRLTGDSVYSEGFQFAPVPKLLTPWLEVFESLGNKVTGRVNRTAAIGRAHAATTMSLGGMDYFTMFARMLHVQSSLDEVGRFFKAAEKTSLLLRSKADDLAKAERKAYDAALAANKSEEAAKAAGQRARFKAWKGIAREGGFGGNWQVAAKMQRHGLLDARRLASLRQAGEATGALQEGTFKTLDFNELMRFTGNTAEENSIFNESFTALRDMIVETIHKRVSEQNLMQSPTSETSRTWLGRTQLSMTSFARSWYDNNIMDTAQMPLRAATGLISVYLIGETMNMIMRDLWNGRTIEDTLGDIEADPDNFVARSLTRLPLIGANGSWLMPVVDSLTKDGRTHRIDTGESAAEGAIASTMDIVLDGVHGAVDDESEVQSRTWRTAARFMPGYRSWWASLLATGAEQTGVFKPDRLPGAKGSRYQTHTRGKISIAPIPDFLQGETLPESQIPDDLSFLYPEID